MFVLLIFISSNIAAIVCSQMNFGIDSLVIREAINLIGVSVVNLCLAKPEFKFLFSWEDVVFFFSKGKYLFASNVCIKIREQVDKILLFKILNASGVAQFSRGEKSSKLIRDVAISPLQQILLVAFSDVKKNKKLTNKMLDFVFYFSTRVGLFLGVIFFFIGSDFIYLLYGEKWRMAGNVLEIMSFFSMFTLITFFIRIVLMSQDMFRQVGFLVYIELIIFLILTPVMTFLYGVEGAALASVFTAFLVCGFHCRKIYLVLDVNLLKESLAPLFFTICLCLVGDQVKKLMIDWSCLLRMSTILISVSVSFLLFLIIFEYSKIVKNIEMVLRQFKNK